MRRGYGLGNIQIDGLGSNNPSITYMIEVDSHTKPWEVSYPHSLKIDEFELSESLVISTTVSAPTYSVQRQIAEGDFYYSTTNTLVGGTIKKLSRI